MATSAEISNFAQDMVNLAKRITAGAALSDKAKVKQKEAEGIALGIIPLASTPIAQQGVGAEC